MSCDSEYCVGEVDFPQSVNLVSSTAAATHMIADDASEDCKNYDRISGFLVYRMLS